MGETSKFDSELQSAVQDRMGPFERALEQTRDKQDELLKEHAANLERHVALQSRVKYLEKVVGDAAEKQLQLQEEHQARANEHLGLRERLLDVEKILEDDADRHVRTEIVSWSRRVLTTWKISSLSPLRCMHSGSVSAQFTTKIGIHYTSLSKPLLRG